MSSEYRELARRLAAIEARLDGASGSQLRYSSLEDAAVPEYDADGKLVSTWGRQPDGTHGIVPVNGPPPPIPAGIELTPDAGGVWVRWLGEWEALPDNPDQAATPTVAPLDFSHVEVHASTEAGFSGLMFSTLVSQISTARGGSTFVPTTPDTDYFFRLVARSTSGKASIPSDIAGPMQGGKVGVTDLGFDIDEIGGSKISYGPDAPVDPEIGNLWYAEVGTDPATGEPTYEALQWNGTEWKELQSDRVREALATAVAAQQKADQAGVDALAAHDEAIDAQTAATAAANAAAGKTTTFRQADAPPTTGRTIGDEWIETDQGNRRHLWTGAWTLTQIGAAGISATARQLGAITTYRQDTAPSTGVLNGDFWIRSTDNRIHVRVNGAWVESKDTEINTAITNAATARAIADGKMRIFVQPEAPTGLVASDEGDLWIDSDNGNRQNTWSGTAWVERRIGNGAIEPKSLVASDVIATGTITAALFQAIMVLASVLIAGEPNGFHARIDDQGIRVYRVNPDGAVVQAGQFGGQTGTGDFMSGGLDEHGNPLWSIDESGVPTFQGGYFAGDPVIMGRPFTQWVGAASGSGNGQPELSGAENTVGWVDGSIGGVTSEIGLAEAVVNVDKNRWYKVGCEVNYARAIDTEAVFRVRDGGTGSPTLSSPIVFRRNFSGSQPFYDATTGWSTGVWYPTTSGVHRLGLTAQAQGAGVIDVRTLLCLPTIIVEDMGPRKPISASVNRMGGGTNPPPPPPAPTQQHYRDIPAGAWAAYRGDGSVHTSATGPVQGYTQYAPSNGNSKGHWTFALPSITGTIDRIDFYVYCDHWHYNSGGTAIFNIAITGNPYVKPKPDWYIGGYPKGNEKTVTLPADWYPFFRNGGANGFARADGITVGGPGAGTDPLYYGRFSGTRAALRIWYTQ